MGFLRPEIFFTNCKKFYNLIFTKTVTAEIFSRTPLPVGIGMFFYEKHKKTDPFLTRMVCQPTYSYSRVL